MPQLPRLLLVDDAITVTYVFGFETSPLCSPEGVSMYLAGLIRTCYYKVVFDLTANFFFLFQK